MKDTFDKIDGKEPQMGSNRSRTCCRGGDPDSGALH